MGGAPLPRTHSTPSPRAKTQHNPARTAYADRTLPWSLGSSPTSPALGAKVWLKVWGKSLDFESLEQSLSFFYEISRNPCQGRGRGSPPAPRARTWPCKDKKMPGQKVPHARPSYPPLRQRDATDTRTGGEMNGTSRPFVRAGMGARETNGGGRGGGASASSSGRHSHSEAKPRGKTLLLNPTPHTLHPTPHTLHPTPYMPHSLPQTPHPEP